MILTNVRDTIHADSLALFELNIEMLFADVTKLEKSNIFTGDPEVIEICFPTTVFPGLSNAA